MEDWNGTIGVVADLVSAAATTAAVVAAVVVWRGQQREGRHLAAQERILGAAREMLREVDLALAALLPFWKNAELRDKHAGVPAEVEVHNHFEPMLSGQVMLDATLSMTDDRVPTERADLQDAATVCAEAMMTLYLLVVPAKPDWEGDAFALLRNQLVDGSPAARAIAEDIIEQVRPAADRARTAAALATKARVRMLESLAAYSNAANGR